jgi:OOP family OmpA-OmpF porin
VPSRGPSLSGTPLAFGGREHPPWLSTQGFSSSFGANARRDEWAWSRWRHSPPRAIQENPQIKRIEVGGHASTEGSNDHNLRLSDRRANAVMTHLVAAGVDAARLTSKGYGETKPLVHPDDAEEQREVNRRVEFLIVEQEVTQRQVQVDPATGEETALGSPAQPVSAEGAQ